MAVHMYRVENVSIESVRWGFAARAAQRVAMRLLWRPPLPALLKSQYDCVHHIKRHRDCVPCQFCARAFAWQKRTLMPNSPPSGSAPVAST